MEQNYERLSHLAPFLRARFYKECDAGLDGFTGEWPNTYSSTYFRIHKGRTFDVAVDSSCVIEVNLWCKAQIDGIIELYSILHPVLDDLK
jgi:hypothetical protein